MLHILYRVSLVNLYNNVFQVSFNGNAVISSEKKLSWILYDKFQSIVYTQKARTVKMFNTKE